MFPLAHNANGDACEAWLTEDYNFDLTPIKTMYQEGYRQKQAHHPSTQRRTEHKPCL